MIIKTTKEIQDDAHSQIKELAFGIDGYKIIKAGKILDNKWIHLETFICELQKANNVPFGVSNLIDEMKNVRTT